MKQHLTTALAACVCSLGLAVDPIEYKTKSDKVRDMSTDRPDQTESAFTVPKGWFQIESSLLSYSNRLDTDERSETFTWGEMNVKYGLSDNTDIQFIWQPYIQNRQRGAPGESNANQAGVSDLLVRFKWNVVGNDDGPFAMSLMPFVKIPTATHRVGNDMWEGGLLINTQTDLGGGFTLGNTFFGGMAIDADDEHYFRPGATASLGYGITEKVGVYTEIFSAWQYDTERCWQTSFDMGFTYLVNANLQLDIGANWFFRGDEAINPFVGVSWRF